MATGESIPDEHHVFRWVAKTRAVRDKSNNIVGSEPSAFAPQEGQKSLSCSWLEYYTGTLLERQRAAAQDTKNSMLNPKTNRSAVSNSGAFALGNVRDIKKTCLVRNRECTVMHTPRLKNLGHATVFSSFDELELMQDMAQLAWAAWVDAADLL